MSQRVHSCTNNTNLETIQCETYANRLFSKHQEPKPRTNNPTKSIHTTKTAREIVPLNRQMSLAISPRSIRQSTSQLSRAESFVRKELYTENQATVEVTVKTHNPKMKSVSSKDTWGKILKQQTSNENISTFTNFDPLRTIHFLAKELQCKLQQSLPNDVNVHQMIIEMQKALNRVPPDIQCAASMPIHLKADKCDMRPTKLIKDAPVKKKATVVEVIKAPVNESSTQTPQNLFIEPDKLQQHLEESSEKIEKACIQMEMLCAQLKMEKEELEVQLNTEKEKVKAMNKQIDEYKIKSTTSTTLIDNLQKRNTELMVNMKRLEQEIENEMKQGPSAQELKNFIQKLQDEKREIEEECMQLKHQLTIAIMEHEKYEAILQARDTQVREIKNEMAALQEVVNEQLAEFQNPITSESSITNTTTASAIWQDAPDKLAKELEQTLTSINSTMGAIKMNEFNQNSPIKEEDAVSGESDESQDRDATPNLKKRSDKSLVSLKKSSSTLAMIKERFDEIKRQAMACSSPAQAKN